ncbi:UDP-glycosyltransferase 82A1 [Punica granatum]|uniref:Glycosyltransferase n=2 Tax=Punica granatum TaxID=22663 RepID=A0A218X9C9_PUNGR|nr:UDP-glycosyltransferase 82A1 [Punica granatum]OWM81567.1 hypothetical protein CDL15_Pgr007605 [Punica granatum]PKI41035.1 hypothetical protein CRG98_038563 [Punica granatum]
MKVILVPYPAQGHVTPMLQLAVALLPSGFEPVLVTLEHIHRRIKPDIEQMGHVASMVKCVVLQDGLESGGARDFFAIEAAMEDGSMAVQLERLVSKLDDCENGEGVVLMVVDVLASWAMEVGHRCGVPTAGFWVAMIATYQVVAAIPDLVRHGVISYSGTPRHKETKLPCLVPNQPTLTAEDLPWLIGSTSCRKGRFKFWTRTMDRCRSLRWLLVNSFPEEHCTAYNNIELNEYVVDNRPHVNTKNNNDNEDDYYPMVFPVGPLSKLAVAPTARNPSFWEEERTCLDWLDQQDPGSVIYVSFGSWVSPIGEDNMRSLALSLEASGRPFIWALSPTWRDGLPNGYIERVANRGKVVPWAPQLEILQNDAVGCFVTHCGWNSTMEAIQCKKRLVCYPVAGDQFVNCKYIVEVWKIGVRIDGFEEKEIEECLREAMEDKEMGRRVRELCERTMGEEARLRLVKSLRGFTDDLHKIIAEDS